jgi:hypothetical protein
MPLEDEMAPVGTNLGDEMASAVVASQFQCHLTDVSSFYCWGQINNAGARITRLVLFLYKKYVTCAT